MHEFLVLNTLKYLVTSLYFLFFSTVLASGVKYQCKNVTFAFPIFTSIFSRFTGGLANKSKVQKVYYFCTR